MMFVSAQKPGMMRVAYLYRPDNIRKHVKCYPIDNRGYERHLYMCYRKEMYFAKYMDDLRIIIEETLQKTFHSPKDH